VPDFGALYAKRIRVLGRRLLLQDTDSSGARVCRLYDVHTGRDVWRQVFTPGALIMRSEDPNIAGVVEKDHTVTLMDARTGEVLVRSLFQGEHADKLQGVALLSDRDRFYLALVREREFGHAGHPNLTYGLRSMPINGPIYALGRTTGKIEWICDFVPHQNLLMEQVEDLPMFLFTTTYTKTGQGGNVERNSSRVTAVDKRTGKLLYDKELGQQGTFQSMRTDPKAGTIELIRNDLKIAFRLDGAVATADPLPERPATLRGIAAPPPAPVIFGREVR
jgi:hypothetical protein